MVMDEKKLNDRYMKYIKESKEWQDKRSERLKIDNYTCQRCGSKRNLQVHHLTYANFGHEDVHNDLITMCKNCHEDIEREKRENARPQDFVLREVKRLEDVERVEKERLEKKNQDKQIEHNTEQLNVEEVTVDWAKEEAEKKILRDRRIINTKKFLDDNQHRDIGFGGKENLSGYDYLDNVIKKYGLDVNEVDRFYITKYFVYKRWQVVLDLNSKGMTAIEIAKHMGWKYDRVRKILDNKEQTPLTMERFKKDVDEFEKKLKTVGVKYKDIQFCYDIEARWAVFFDECGFKWEYRPKVVIDGYKCSPSFRLYDIDRRAWSEEDLQRPFYIYAEMLENAVTRSDIFFMRQEYPMYIVKDIPYSDKIIDYFSEIDVNCPWGDYDYFSYSLVDGDSYLAGLFANKEGQPMLVGCDHEWDDIDWDKTKRALMKAKNAKFENIS